MTASIFSIELTWRPHWRAVRGLGIYGQFVLNEVTTPYEGAHWSDTQPPNALGYLAGVEYARGFGAWSGRFYGEFVYTDPYLYVNNSPFAAFIWMRNLSLAPDRERYTWIGHPEGRDRIIAALGTTFTWGTRGAVPTLILDGKVAVVIRGRHTIQWDWSTGAPATEERTPSGGAATEVTAQVAARWQILTWLGIAGSVTGVFGADQSGAEFSFAVTAAY